MQTRTVQPRLLLGPMAYAAAGLLLFGLWLRNYNLAGNLYDYSIMASACGHLQADLRPYRDFTTPLQSLTIYAGYAAEKLFSPRYLSLAYANLLLALGFYTAILWSLRNCLPFLLRLLTAVALCGATVLQHGILWYNSIAIVLLTLIVWRAAVWYREGRRSSRHCAALCLLLFLSSMTKLNFHFLGLGVTLGLLPFIFLRLPSVERKRFVWIFPAILFCGLILGPAVEILFNGTTLHDFLENVVSAPQGRFGRISRVLNPKLYLGRVADNFPDNWSGGIFLYAGLVYAGCLWLFLRRPAGPTSRPEGSRAPFSDKLLMILVLPGFYVGGVLLVVTNDETQMLTSAFLLVGLVSAFIMFAPVMADIQGAGFRFGIFLLAGFFAVAGGASAFMHSRIRWGEPSWMDTVLKAANTEKGLSAMRTAVPFYLAADINPRLDNYLHGVRLTEPVSRAFRRLFTVLDENHLHEQPQRIYWGPGLEIMNRVYGTVPAGHLPLWYDADTSVTDRDSHRIIAALRQDDFEWIITAGFYYSMPPGVRAWITDNYDSYQSTQDDPGLVVFRKKTRAVASSPTPAGKPLPPP